MTSLASLWLPMVLSAVLVFVVSSVIHMASPWHKDDYARVPNEDQVRAALQPLNLPPGDYMVPRPQTRAEMSSPEFMEKVNKGPNLILNVGPNGAFKMGQTLGAWFVYLLVVGLFAGYLTSRAFGPGEPYLHVFRFVGTTAFVGYTLSLWQMSIWFRRSWAVTIKATVDGLIYALLTAGAFGWLWPR
ncbi:MAG: hypothetical protein U0132_02405 [Gemmatimonadaceae bacterium]